MKRAGRLITVSGTDCSGKTTQIELLENALTERGEQVERFWFRPGYSQEMDAARKLVRRLVPRALPTHTQASARQAAFERPGVSSSWVAMAVLDTLLQYTVRLRALLLQGRTVICDRFIWDAGLDLDLRFPELSALHKPALAAVRKCAPRPALSILLLVPYEILSARAAIKNEPFPDSEEQRLERWDCYGQMRLIPGLVTIDANRLVESVHEDILRMLDAT